MLNAFKVFQSFENCQKFKVNFEYYKLCTESSGTTTKQAKASVDFWRKVSWDVSHVMVKLMTCLFWFFVVRSLIPFNWKLFSKACASGTLGTPIPVYSFTRCITCSRVVVHFYVIRSSLEICLWLEHKFIGLKISNFWKFWLNLCIFSWCCRFMINHLDLSLVLLEDKKCFDFH